MGQTIGAMFSRTAATTEVKPVAAADTTEQQQVAAAPGVGATATTLTSAAPAETKEDAPAQKAGIISRIFSAVVSVPVAIVKAILFIPVSIAKAVWYVVRTPVRNAETKAAAELAAVNEELQAAQDLAEAAEKRAAYLQTWKGAILNLFGRA